VVPPASVVAMFGVRSRSLVLFGIGCFGCNDAA
jgi:hypothetical protein